MNIQLSLMKSKAGSLAENIILPLKAAGQLEAFIETGTYLGGTVEAMRRIFDKVISIELSDELYSAAKKKFANDSGICLLKGDSANCLSEALQLSNGQNSLIWLDAHWSGGNTAKSGQNTPIIDELEILASTGCETHIILIDDIRYFIDLPQGFDVHEANGGYPRLSLVSKIIGRFVGNYQILIVGDILLALPESISKKLNVSEIVLATSKLRLELLPENQKRNMEAIISDAEGVERETIIGLPDFYADSLKYGIGGEFCYWRGLVHEKSGALDLAKNDFLLARKCGVSIPTRDWE